jgi:serine/threonine protein kinase
MADPIHVPQMVGKRYRIVEPIGAGGMGEVFRGQDSQSEQPVAIKRLKAEALADAPDLIERFQREGEALRQLDPSWLQIRSVLDLRLLKPLGGRRDADRRAPEQQARFRSHWPVRPDLTELEDAERGLGVAAPD